MINPISALFFILTFIFYVGFRKLYLTHKKWWLTPLLPSVFFLILLTLWWDVPFEDYFRYNQLWIWFLGPVTVAYAVPLFEYRELAKKYWRSLLIGSVFSIFLSIVLGLLITRLLGLDVFMQKSFLTRSISTPFAIVSMAAMGESEFNMAIVFISIVGIFTNLSGFFWLQFFKIKNPVAQSVAMGCVGHGLATARSFEKGTNYGVISSLSLMIAGMITMTIAPLYNLFFF